MANEATIRSGLTLRVGALRYNSEPASFRADVSAAMGPTPGAFLATEDGVDIDLSALHYPGLCVIRNLEDPDDETSPSVVFGRWDPDTDLFYPSDEVAPGECFVKRLPLSISDEFSGTGTGTTATASTWRVKVIGTATGNATTAVVSVEAFER